MTARVSKLACFSLRRVCQVASILAVTGTIAMGCSGSVDGSDSIAGTGGGGAGGVDIDAAAGGTSGKPITGGAAGTGGIGPGGTPETGGAAAWPNTGGTPETGGAAGWPNTGGVAGTGGWPETGGTAGWPATGGMPNTGGTPGTGGSPSLPCVPGMVSSCGCAWGAIGTHSCAPDGNGYGICVCSQTEGEVLAWYQAAIVGDWAGIATNPWQGQYDVVFTFRADGTYFAQCVGAPPDCLALYYGEDIDSPLRRYILDDVKANHSATGEIAQVVGPELQYDAMQEIVLDESMGHLWISIMHAYQYGPINLDLHRVGP